MELSDKLMDLLEIFLKSLNKHEVEFLVVGGVAVNIMGIRAAAMTLTCGTTPRWQTLKGY